MAIEIFYVFEHENIANLLQSSRSEKSGISLSRERQELSSSTCTIEEFEMEIKINTKKCVAIAPEKENFGRNLPRFEQKTVL